MDKSINSHCIRIYFNDNEYALLSEQEIVLGITKQQLVRRVLIEKARPTIINARELLSIFDQIGEKIAVCNELMYKYFSEDGAVHAAPSGERNEESFAALLEDYLSVQKSLEQAIRLLLFKIKT